MVWSLKNLFARAGSRPSLDWIDLEAAGFPTGHSDSEASRNWRSPEGDAISLHLFAKPPDLPVEGSILALEQFYRDQIPAPAKLVEVRLVSVGSRKGLQVILKFPQQPSGMAYVGSTTIPFRDISFVVKVQCHEHGLTGVREAILFDRSRAEATDSDTDAEQHDREFPQHPLSRVRRHLRQIASGARWAPQVASLAPFQLPG